MWTSTRVILAIARPPSFALAARSRSLGSALRKGRVLADKPLVPQFLPEGGRNRVAEIADVGRDLIRAEGTWDDRGHARMAERELQGGRLERHAVAPADRLDTSDLVQHLGRGVCVVVLGARNGSGRGDAG